MNSGEAIRILLIEDDDVDAMAVTRGFQRERIANEIVRAKDGVEALEMLRGAPEQTQLKSPFVIFLDLNMPRMNGFEFLDELRADPSLSKLVVFVLTTSEADEDRVKAYDRNVAGYVVKSEAGAQFFELVKLIDHFWRVVVLP